MVRGPIQMILMLQQAAVRPGPWPTKSGSSRGILSSRQPLLANDLEEFAPMACLAEEAVVTAARCGGTDAATLHSAGGRGHFQRRPGMPLAVATGASPIAPSHPTPEAPACPVTGTGSAGGGGSVAQLEGCPFGVHVPEDDQCCGPSALADVRGGAMGEAGGTKGAEALGPHTPKAKSAFHLPQIHQGAGGCAVAHGTEARARVKVPPPGAAARCTSWASATPWPAALPTDGGAARRAVSRWNALAGSNRRAARPRAQSSPPWRAPYTTGFRLLAAKGGSKHQSRRVLRVGVGERGRR